MLRILILVIALALVGAAAAWIADHPGAVALDLAGRRIEASLSIVAGALIVLVVLVILGYRLLHWLLAGPGQFVARQRERRKEKGWQVLSEGLVAVAAGDPAKARKLATRAGALLDDKPLTLLLSAQAAQLQGDEPLAQRYFEQMRTQPETEFLGLRGLIVQARRRSENDRALSLLRRAQELRPNTPWVVRELAELEARIGEPDRALSALEEAARRKLVDKPAALRHRAVLTQMQAEAAEARGEDRKALELAERAHGLDAGFVPATALAIRLQAAVGNLKKARKLAHTAWQAGPHPDLIAALRDAEGRPEAGDWLTRLRELTRKSPGAPESRLALAEAALEAGDPALAEENLQAVLAEGQSGRACRLMARLMEARGDSAGVRAWLARAAADPAPEAWTCRDCGHRAEGWQGRCPACGAFDSLDWRRPLGMEAPRPIPESETAAAPAAGEDGDTAEQPDELLEPPANLLPFEVVESPEQRDQDQAEEAAPVIDLEAEPAPKSGAGDR